jgi:hypothetical protein
MSGHKKLINRTGKEVNLVLFVRKGDLSSQTAGSVNVTLAPGPDKETGEYMTEQVVTYGDDVDIYLNGLEVTLTSNGQEVTRSNFVAERGSKLDRILNMNDTIDFRFDGESILFSAINTGVEGAG